MPLAFFKNAIKTFPDPWKTMVRLMDYYWDKDYFSNKVVSGEYDGEGEAFMNAWLIAGIAPGYPNFLECASYISESDKTKLKNAIPSLCAFQDIVDAAIQGGVVQAALGADKIHVIGMLSFHTTAKSGKEFFVVWAHPEISSELVQKILRTVLEEQQKKAR